MREGVFQTEEHARRRVDAVRCDVGLKLLRLFSQKQLPVAAGEVWFCEELRATQLGRLVQEDWNRVKMHEAVLVDSFEFRSKPVPQNRVGYK